MIFKVTAQGDKVFLKAESLQEAKKRFKNIFGEIPESLMTWTEVKSLPKGETLV